MGYIKLFNTTIDYEDYINGDPLLPNVSLVDEDNIVYYNSEEEVSSEYENEYLSFEALEDGMTVSFNKKATSGSLYYSLDNQEWNELTEAQTINSGEKVYFKGDLVPKSTTGIGIFTISKNCNVAGNVMSLLFADDFVGKVDLTGYDYAFYYLFQNCTTIQSAENLILPANVLTVWCYNSMFQNCINLTTAPKLPATTLGNSCYLYMFSGCTSLTTAPELPATTLVGYCYRGMFQGCTGLTSTPELPATTLAQSCYYHMFKDCSNLNYIKMLATDISASYCLFNWVSGVASTGTFVKADGVEIPTGTSGIPSGWTVQVA